MTPESGQEACRDTVSGLQFEPVNLDAPVRWAIVSTAAIADLVLEGCAESSALEFIAVGSRDQERATAWAAARGIERAYGSYEALLRDPDIEAVYVALPNSLHVGLSTLALEHGKHVLCEKPLGRDPVAVGRAFATADKAGKILREAFMYRFHPQTDELRRLVASGAIGDLKHIRATLTYPMEDPRSDVRSAPELDGGALMDVGCYCVSAYRLLAGEPAIVSGDAIPGPSGVDVRFVGAMRSTNGVTGQFDCGMTLPRRDALELVGDSGTILVPDPWHCRAGLVVVDAQQHRTEVHIDAYDAYRAQFEMVSSAIRRGTMIAFGRDDAVAQANTLAALHAAAEHSVLVDPASNRFRKRAADLEGSK